MRVEGGESRPRLSVWHKAAILAAICLLGFVGYTAYTSWHAFIRAYEEGESSPDLAEISRRSYVRFPRGTRVLDSYMHFQWDSHLLLAKLEMDRANVDDFARTLPHAQGRRDSSKDRLGVTRESWHSFSCYGLREAEVVPSWWAPDSVRHYRAVLTDSYGVTIGVLIDTERPKRAIVYLTSCRG